MEAKDRIKDIIDIQNEMGNVRKHFKNFSSPTSMDGCMYLLLEINNKMDNIIKLNLYKETVEVLKKKLEDDFGVDEATIKTLKNKRELINKIVEVM
mgnify:CR=1 FL=1